MITSIEIAKFAGRGHLGCCMDLYELLEEMRGDPQNYQICRDGKFYYEFSDELGRKLLKELEKDEA